MAIATIQATGHVDEFRPPNVFIGWAGIEDERPDDNAYIAVLLDGTEIGRAIRTSMRPDVRGYGTVPLGFHIETARDVTFKDLRDGRLQVELTTTRGKRTLHLERQIDAARVIEAVTDLLSAATWSDARLQRMLRSLRFNKAMLPQTINQVTACLELLHPDRGLHDVQALSERMQRLNQITDRGSFDTQAVDLLRKFEGIGENCEFGFLQRRFGYEPIRLLRWSRTPLTNLIDALSTGFEGVGTAAQTELVPLWGDEYGTRDKRYDLAAHTFIKTSELRDHAREFAKQCQRLSYLRRLFIDSLSSDAHIFVYYTYGGIGDDESRQLFGALRRYGPNRLLCVRADPSHQGTVTLLEDGLAIGYIDHFSKREAVAENISYQAWLAVLNSACGVFGI